MNTDEHGYSLIRVHPCSSAANMLLPDRWCIALVPEREVRCLLRRPARVGPAELRLADAADLGEQRGAAAGKEEAQTGAAKQEVVEMGHPLGARRPAQL